MSIVRFLLLHERWFTDETRFPVHFDNWLAPHSLIPIAIAVTITAIAVAVWRHGGRRSIVSGPIELGMPRLLPSNLTLPFLGWRERGRREATMTTGRATS